jgi:hypothetical protein
MHIDEHTYITTGKGTTKIATHRSSQPFFGPRPCYSHPQAKPSTPSILRRLWTKIPVLWPSSPPSALKFTEVTTEEQSLWTCTEEPARAGFNRGPRPAFPSPSSAIQRSHDQRAESMDLH